MISTKVKRLLRTRDKRGLIATVWKDTTSKYATSQSPVLQSHLNAIYAWLCAAQDATPDNGVSAWYTLIDGWMPSYPETTGYIISTLFDYSRYCNDLTAHNRAIAMATWEVDVQLSNGAIQGGHLGYQPPKPAVFNTGQVIFGWVAAYRETGDTLYLNAAIRAADWLVDVQDADGAWRRYLSMFTPTTVCTYNARTAWALVQLGRTLEEDKYISAAQRNLAWCLTQQNDKGWFANCGFRSAEIPLLHTIGYVIEGLLESGLLLQEERYIAAARVALEALLGHLGDVGTLRGRYDQDWRAPVRWRCLTGEAQVALCWLRLFEATGESKFLNAGKHVNAQLMALQDLKTSDKGRFGGVKGSYPIWGGYLPFAYPNWAAKFLMDSLLVQQRANGLSCV